MDDSFDQLDQAAVAGADGNPWPIPDLPSVFPAFSPHPTPFDPFPDESTSPPSMPSAPIPVPSSSTSASAGVKLEPLHMSMHPVPSSPSQPSLCSVDSLHSSARPLHLSSSLHKFSTSPLSSSPTSIAQIPDAKSAPSPSCPLTSDSAMPDISPSSPGDLPSTSPPASPHDLIDLTGTTAARSRKMTDDERKVMLHKRRLRNRASAARSREKRSRTLNELTTEVVDLMRKSAKLADQVSSAVEEIRKLHARNVMLAKENQLLKSELHL